MMSKEEFEKIWDASGLPEYYDAMDTLKGFGFHFDSNGDMDYWQSEALNLWLEEEKSGAWITSVDLSEILNDRAAIFNKAKELQKEFVKRAGEALKPLISY